MRETHPYENVFEAEPNHIIDFEIVPIGIDPASVYTCAGSHVTCESDEKTFSKHGRAG